MCSGVLVGVCADASIIDFWHRAPAGALAAVCWGRRYIRIVRRSETIIHRSIGNRSTHHHPSEWAQTRSNEMHVKGQLVRCRKDPPPNEFLGDAATRSRSGQLAEGRGCSSVRRLDRSTLPRIKQPGPHCGHIKPLNASCTGCVWPVPFEKDSCEPHPPASIGRPLMRGVLIHSFSSVRGRHSQAHRASDTGEAGQRCGMDCRLERFDTPRIGRPPPRCLPN